MDIFVHYEPSVTFFIDALLFFIIVKQVKL